MFVYYLMYKEKAINHNFKIPVIRFGPIFSFPYYWLVSMHLPHLEADLTDVSQNSFI